MANLCDLAKRQTGRVTLIDFSQDRKSGMKAAKANRSMTACALEKAGDVYSTAAPGYVKAAFRHLTAEATITMDIPDNNKSR